MFARYQTPCSVCKRQIQPGDEIAKAGSGWSHSTCSPKADVERREAPKPSQFKTGPTWTKNAIIRLLHHDDRAVERAAVALYERQTALEQETASTINKNNVGYNAADAKRLSRAARWVDAGNSLDGWFLEDARDRVIKYAGQLADIANEKEADRPSVRKTDAEWKAEFAERERQQEEAAFKFKMERDGQTFAEQAAAAVLDGASVVDAVGRVMP